MSTECTIDQSGLDQSGLDQSGIDPGDARPGRREAGAGWTPRLRIVTAANLVGGLAVAAAAGAGSPLFVYEQGRWGFPTWLLTAMFGVYALSLLTTLLVAGRLSDHVGRRPVLIGALGLMIIACGLYLRADGAGWLVAARAVHGVATGAALGTFTALIAESVPAPSRGRYTQIAGSAPVAGLALGVLAGGVAVSVASVPTRAVFGPLMIMFAGAIAATLATPETVPAAPGALRSLLPRIAVPAALRGEFVRLLPLIAGTWATTGLFLGLVPALDRSVFDLGVGLTGATVVLLQPAAAAAAGLLSGGVPPRRAVLVGSLGVTVGAAASWAGVAGGRLSFLIIGAVLGGIGTGVGFSATLRLLSSRAGVHERGGLVSAVYVVAYLSFGVPALLAGLVAGHWGLGPTVALYCLALVALGAMALISRLAGSAGPSRTARSSRTRG